MGERHREGKPSEQENFRKGRPKPKIASVERNGVFEGGDGVLKKAIFKSTPGVTSKSSRCEIIEEMRRKSRESRKIKLQFQLRRFPMFEWVCKTIKGAHLAAGYADPTGVNVKHVWAGIHRQHGTKENGKKPVEIELLKQMLREVPDNLGGLRDKAILLIGFAGSLRRSEIVALNIDGIALDPKGLIIQTRIQKGNGWAFLTEA